MTWVKICGTTNLEDALIAVEAGADAVGFVFYEKSPRNIGVEAARGIVEKLPESVEKVGVFVNHSAEQMTSISERARLSAVQVYPFASGERRPISDFFPNGELRVFVAIPGERFKSGDDFGFFLSWEFLRRTDALFFDSGNPQRPGGTGETFDWESASGPVKAMSQATPLVIAGGLTPGNVSEAIGIFKPWGVDVTSGVEMRPGKKDPEKVRAFVRAVREIDRKTS
jgi:phosphoribosylanthranilate isomerase